MAGMYNGCAAGSLDPAEEVDERSFDFSVEYVGGWAARVADDVQGVWMADTGAASCGGGWMAAMV